MRGVVLGQRGAGLGAWGLGLGALVRAGLAGGRSAGLYMRRE